MPLKPEDSRNSALGAPTESALAAAAESGLLSNIQDIELALEASPNAIVMVDEAGKITLVNSEMEKMFGYGRGELLGQPVEMLVPGAMRADHQRHRAHFAKSPSRRPMGAGRELCGLRKDGSQFPLEIGLNFVRTPGGLRVLAAISDVTVRRKIEESLLQAHKLEALGTLAGGMAHDFNNILLTIAGNAKLALSELSPGHAAYLSVVEIAKASSRAAALTKKILAFSRDAEVKREVVSIRRLVEEALTQLRATLPLGIEVRSRFAPNLPPISADPVQVREAILNLGSNAADAIGERSGILEIAASAMNVGGDGSSMSSRLLAGPYVKVSIKDTGPGMDKRVLGRIFEPFFTTKTQGRGTGMGLAIVHGIMKNHAGDVTAYSEAGKGAVFNLYFPAATELPAEAPPAAAPAKGQGQHILYVDDEEPLVMLVTRTLKRLGYEVTGTTDAAGALRTFRENPATFDAVVTDLSMPLISGTDLAKEVLQIRPDIPVILTTGYIRPQDQELAKRIGVCELILKPDTVDELGSVLNRLLTEGPPAKADGASAG